MRRSVNEITTSRRMRRNRRFEWSRRLVRENQVSVDDLIWPIFLIEGKNTAEPINSMPDVERLSVDKAVEAAKKAYDLGVPAIATFANIPISKRDESGSAILDPRGVVNEATQAIKSAVPEIGVITDVALDPFTSHGHDGILKDGKIINDETVELISKAAVIQADAGADIIAPSEMMDGRIGAIRDALDDNGHEDVAIMSYAAKYCSGFYGPFRDAADSPPKFGDRQAYQMDPANALEAIREVTMDIEEGADIIMVKPALPYLDIICRVREEIDLPVAAYSVSGGTTKKLTL